MSYTKETQVLGNAGHLVDQMRTYQVFYHFFKELSVLYPYSYL